MENSRDNDSLIEYWNTLVQRRWVVILATVACGLLALIGSFIATPIYRSSATLQIDRQNPDVLNQRDLAKTDYSWAAYEDFYQTQYKIIASEAVALRVVERMGLTDHPDMAPDSRKPSLFSRARSALRSIVPSRGESTAISPEQQAIGMVLAGLTVEPIRNSQLVRISWAGTDPNFTAEVTNNVARAFITYNLESSFSTTEEAEDFLLRQIGNLRQDIIDAEAKLQTYGEEKNIVSIDDGNNITLQALRELSNQETDARTRLAQAEARFRSVDNADPSSLPEVLNSTLIQQLRREYAATEAEYSALAKRFKEGWPGLDTLKTQLKQTGDRLEQETQFIADQVQASAESAYRRARAEVENLTDLRRRQESAAQLQRRDSVEYISLLGQVNKKRETLDSLMRRQNEMALSLELRSFDSVSTNVRIVEPARAASAPFKPNTSINLIVGLMLGMACGVGLALALDYLDNTVNSPADIDRILSLPTLASIPRQEIEENAVIPQRADDGRGSVIGAQPLDLITYTSPRAPASEAYRELRTAILLSHAGEPPRQMMITSAEPGEGKSSTTMNLAVALAQLGQRVLVVDTDLRRPRLHKVFDLPNDRGVTTYLSGLADTVDGLAHPTVVENLEILCSGPIPPNPSELLNSPRFNQLGRELLQKGYEHIVYDSAPLLAVSDPVIISSRVEATILVVRAGKTAKQAIQSAAEKLRQTSKGASGVVLNGVELDSSSSRYHYYGDDQDDSEAVRPSSKPLFRARKSGTHN